MLIIVRVEVDTRKLIPIARMILNYKNIDYKTEWVEYPDLAPKFKSLYFPSLYLLPSPNSPLPAAFLKMILRPQVTLHPTPRPP